MRGKNEKTARAWPMSCADNLPLLASHSRTHAHIGAATMGVASRQGKAPQQQDTSSSKKETVENKKIARAWPTACVDHLLEAALQLKVD